MKKNILALPLIMWMLFAASTAYCSTYYVDPNGNNANPGDIDHPFKTIPTAVTAASAGDTIYLRGVSHPYSTTITITKNGAAGAKINMFAYPGDPNRPILDFSSMSEASANRGIQLNASYWYIKGIDIYKAGDNGMIIEKNSASYNRIEFCRFYENRDSGLQLANGAQYNEIINCDSYYNRDVNQGNADGFSPKLTLGTGNCFYGCRSWQNSDDAYDCYLNAPTDNVTTTFENCWAFKAGYLKDGTQGTGNGNGFKMGSSTNNHNIILKNCLSFQNKAKGFDQNHNKGSMTLYNCTAFGNGGSNFSIYDTLTTGKTATVVNSLYYTGGSNNLGTFVVQKTNGWLSPFVVNSGDFASIDPSAAYGPRNADGSLPTITFMHLVAGSDLIDGGTIDANVTWFYYGSKPDLGCFEYGGCTEPYASDVNGNCEVDFIDYAIMVNAWKDSLSDADLNNDGHINLMDLDTFATEWLLCNRNPASECWK